LAFGKDLERRTGVPIGLLVCSHGGTSLAQWSPDLLDQGGASLYGSLARRIAAAGGKVRGVAWYQGESDAMDPATSRNYARSFAAFVRAVRELVADPTLAWVYVQIGCFYVDGASREMVEGWDAVQDAQVRVESDIQPAAFTTAIDLALSDAIHVETAGLRRLGRRLGYLAHKVAYGSADGEIGPRPAGVTVAPDRKTVEVKFDHVNGGLRPEGRAVGIVVYRGDDPVPPTRCEVGADRRCVVLEYADPLPAGAVLYYGRGLNPACGLADEADLPVPVFGPVSL
jgi:sialate O-acetylesterase